MCRKPIAVGGKVIKCSVSTCNSGRVRLVFCSASCWDSHLPGARHRSAYFTEEVARREAEAPQGVALRSGVASTASRSAFSSVPFIV